MSFYERFILKGIRDFQNLTAEEKQKYLTLFKHKYLSVWLTCKFMKSIIPNTVGFVLLLINLALNIVVKGTISNIVFFTTMPIIIFIIIIEWVIIYKYKRKKQTVDEIGGWLVEKFQNLWLLNWHVISFKDWFIIKKKDRVLYEKARSEDCNHKCYFTSYALANTLENPDIRILWICIGPLDNKFGHAVIVRNDKVYDSNLRRTYGREEYLRAFNAEVFKEYSINEYLNKENLHQSHFTFLDWEEFGEWCKERNAVRDD